MGKKKRGKIKCAGGAGKKAIRKYLVEGWKEDKRAVCVALLGAVVSAHEITRRSTVDSHYRTLWRKAAMTDRVADGTRKRGGAPAACRVLGNTSRSATGVFTPILDSAFRRRLFCIRRCRSNFQFQFLLYVSASCRF